MRELFPFLGEFVVDVDGDFAAEARRRFEVALEVLGGLDGFVLHVEKLRDVVASEVCAVDQRRDGQRYVAHGFEQPADAADDAALGQHTVDHARARVPLVVEQEFVRETVFVDEFLLGRRDLGANVQGVFLFAQHAGLLGAADKEFHGSFSPWCGCGIPPTGCEGAQHRARSVPMCARCSACPCACAHRTRPGAPRVFLWSARLGRKRCRAGRAMSQSEKSCSSG